jgi:hypothetical protein
MSPKTDTTPEQVQHLDAPISLTPDQIEQVAGAALGVVDWTDTIWKFGTPAVWLREQLVDNPAVLHRDVLSVPQFGG